MVLQKYSTPRASTTPTKQLSQLASLESLESTREEVIIISVAIEVIYSSIALDMIVKTISFFIISLTKEQTDTIEDYLNIYWGIGNTILLFTGRYYKDGVLKNINEQGLVICNYILVYLAELVHNIYLIFLLNYDKTMKYKCIHRYVVFLLFMVTRQITI